MRYLLYILGHVFLFVLATAHTIHNSHHAPAHGEDNDVQKWHHEHRNDLGKQCAVTKWSTKLVTLVKTKTMTRTRTKTAVQKIVTTKIKKVVPMPTTVWKTHNVLTTKTVMKISIATVTAKSAPKTITKTVTKQSISTVTAKVTPKTSTVTKTLTKEVVVNKSIIKTTTETVMKEYVITATAKSNPTTVTETITKELVTTVTAQSPQNITISQTQVDKEFQRVLETCSTKAAVSTIISTITETATSIIFDTIPTTIIKEVTVLETISQPITSPTTITETVTVTGPPGVVTETGATITVTVTDMNDSVCSSAAPETAYTQTKLTTTSTILGLPTISDTSTHIDPGPTNLSSMIESSLSESATPSTELTTTTSTTTALEHPPTCTFDPTILYSSFEQGVTADLWDLTTLPYGTTGTAPSLSPPISAHGGLRAVRIRAGVASPAKVRMGITRDISNGICSGYGYIVNVWIMAPLLGGSLVGRCTIELWWSETVDALRTGRRSLGGNVVPEDGVWRKVQGTFVQASGVEAGQLQIVMSCDGTGERYLYLDDVEIVRMS